MSDTQRRAADELASLLEAMRLESSQKLLGIAFAEGLSVGAQLGKGEDDDKTE